MKWIEDGKSSCEFECSSDKKNVFLIGDSIRRGYCATVKRELEDVANVFYINENCRSTQYVIFCMREWAGKFDDPSLVDVVHFNCGHWDVAHWNEDPQPLTSKAEYEKNIGIIIRALKKFFPNAKLVFATTSPMNPSGILGKNPRSNSEIDLYNEIAVRVAASMGAEVRDMNAYMRSWGSEYYSDYVHLTAEGFEILGKHVAGYLKEML